MKLKSMKKSLAVLLTAALLVPAQPVMGANGGEPPEADTWKTAGKLATGSNSDPNDIPDGDIFDEESLENDLLPHSSSNWEVSEEIVYNTGEQEIHVVDPESYEKGEQGDGCFEEDGSYTIQIPELNPFFPYEVQFSYDDQVETRWFMDPEDCVEIDGHKFYVEPQFDGTEVTQMSLNVAGTTVVVYPEAKTFTNGGGWQTFSLLPLKEKYLEVDLTGVTPIELTMVSIQELFAGETEVEDTDKIVWSYMDGSEDYHISSYGDNLDLSIDTISGNSYWEMIVGEADQLASSNLRYMVDVTTTESAEWLIPALYGQKYENPEDPDGAVIREKVDVEYFEYYDYDTADRCLEMDVLSENIMDLDQGLFLSLDVNEELFETPGYASLKAYEGFHTSAEEAEAEPDITDKIFSRRMEEIDAGIETDYWEFTLVSYDEAGNVTGVLPMMADAYSRADRIRFSLYGEDGDLVSHRSNTRKENGITKATLTLDAFYPVDGEYRLVLEYEKADSQSQKEVLGAYLGLFESQEAAQSAGAENLKDDFFDWEKGYLADFSKGVNVTVFVGEKDGSDWEGFRYTFITEEGYYQLSGSTYVNFYNLKDGNGKTVQNKVIAADEDDYADQTYLTMLVEEDTDLTNLAPVFSTSSGINLYAAGSSVPEVSGVSTHDFSNGPVQYTASAEDKTHSKNYWLQIVKPSDSENGLYVNSFADKEAETTMEDGTVYSTREMFLDGRYDYKHDLLLINMGREEIPALDVELVSEQLELDDYWTLQGQHQLDGFSSLGNLTNMAKIRLHPKEDVVSGSDISGTLTIKSGEQKLAVFTLTGIVGDPSIITTEIPDAVKFVHYGTMIQNNNKYDFNVPTYRLISGKLPAGMMLKANGELYGVPTETGEFQFRIRMENSYGKFGNSSASFQMTVMENTDMNVENATDPLYELEERIPNIALNDSSDYTMISAGEFGEWENLYLDGKMLVEGVDFDAESGSTRLTIRSQTLKSGNTTGTHTLSAEFRTADKTLKRAAQNYQVTSRSGSSGGGSSSSSGGSSSGGTGNTQNRDPKKGYMTSQSGIVTGTGAGYSRWEQDETGWRLIYADGSAAAGHMMQQEDGSQVEQVLWEKVNGSYYTFGVNGYLKTGWIYDYQLHQWYCVSENSGMIGGWYTESQDGNIYYLEPGSGIMRYGWIQVDGKWYYLNDVVAPPTWVYSETSKTWVYNAASKNKPWGALYRNEKTPDGYRVDENGIWDGQERQ